MKIPWKMKKISHIPSLVIFYFNNPYPPTSFYFVGKIIQFDSFSKHNLQTIQARIQFPVFGSKVDPNVT